MLNQLKARREIRKLAHDWRFWAEKIAAASTMIMGSCEVYVFGSVAKGKDVGASDVDLLIVCDKIPGDNKRRGSLKARIEEEAGLPLYHPFEIHLINTEEANSNPIYRKSISEGVRL